MVLGVSEIRSMAQVESAEQEGDHVDSDMSDAGQLFFLFILRHPVGLKNVVTDKVSINPVHVVSLSDDICIL